MEQSLAQIYKENLMIMTQSLEQYKNQMILFQKKYDMLREDYLYNLRVINERDEELRKCDSQISLLNSVQLSSEYHFIDSCIDERERKGVSESNLWVKCCWGWFGIWTSSNLLIPFQRSHLYNRVWKQSKLLYFDGTSTHCRFVNMIKNIRMLSLGYSNRLRLLVIKTRWCEPMWN